MSGSIRAFFASFSFAGKMGGKVSVLSPANRFY